MTYTLKVSDELLKALNEAGRDEVRGVLSRHFGVEHVVRGRGRPRKGTHFEEKGTPIQKKEPVIGNRDPLKEMGSISVKGDPIPKEGLLIGSTANETPLEKGDPVPSWKAKLEADRERIARRKAVEKKEKTVNHDQPPVEAPDTGGVDDEF